jgi:hypothetical protein
MEHQKQKGMEMKLMIVEFHEPITIDSVSYRTLRASDGWLFQEKLGGLVCYNDLQAHFVPWHMVAPSRVDRESVELPEARQEVFVSNWPSDKGPAPKKALKGS